MDPSLGQTTEPVPQHIAVDPPSPVANASMFIITNDEGSSFFSLINIETITTVTTANTAKISAKISERTEACKHSMSTLLLITSFYLMTSKYQHIKL